VTYYWQCREGEGWPVTGHTAGGRCACAQFHPTPRSGLAANSSSRQLGRCCTPRFSAPSSLTLTSAFDDDVGELYDTTKDWTHAADLSNQMPEKLHELQRLWLIEATRCNVLPIDDDTAGRLNSDLAGRPTLIKGNTQLLFGGMGRLSENCVVNIKNKSHAVIAEIEVPDAGAEGVIIAQGANIGGWSLYAACKSQSPRRPNPTTTRCRRRKPSGL
jgi:hypothetical protein